MSEQASSSMSTATLTVHRDDEAPRVTHDKDVFAQEKGSVTKADVENIPSKGKSRVAWHKSSAYFSSSPSQIGHIR